MHPEGATPIPRKLPFYQHLVRECQDLCKEIRDMAGCQASVTVAEPQGSAEPIPTNHSFETQRPKSDIVIGIWIAGTDQQSIAKLRSMFLHRCPVQLTTASVDLEHDLFYQADGLPREDVLDHLTHISNFTGTGIFVLKPEESKASAAGDPEVDASQAKRLRIKIYGDYESVEHAKTRALIFIDDLLGNVVAPTYIEVSMHSLICGRGRKNIKQIESATRTAVYFPPPFPRVYAYVPRGCQRRHPDEIFITGACRENISKAEQMLNTLSLQVHAFVKQTALSFRKIDFILLERLDEIRKIMETNGTYVALPALGSGQSCIRVQGAETLHIERTIRAIMTIAGQYYDASWWMMSDLTPVGGIRAPTPLEFQQILVDISTKSGADASFSKNFFEIAGSDWAVRRCLELLNEVDYVRCSNHQVRVKIELANEHKEFVAGKKNGKINKIMASSNIHILFDGFSEYNFYIDVVGQRYDSVKLGLELVEQELPAAMSFHVPDSYHKRIIGVGGQHIQTIMKKYSVFVKFSNAMERGTAGKVENEDLKVDNVICRTPARNAANLELVKAEIMEMVQQVDADIVSESVEIPRLFHRTMIGQRSVIDELEKKWSCSVSFPSTELASDSVTIKGPEWQIPHFKEGLLALVPESHEIRLIWSPELAEVVKEERFNKDVVEVMKERMCITMKVEEAWLDSPIKEQKITFSYTRNDAGGLQDAIDLLMNHLTKRGVHAEVLQGRLSRPKSDSFEDFAPYFSSAVLQSSGGSQDGLNRPGSRLSLSDANSVLGDGKLSSEPGRIMSETEAAFYNGDRRRGSGQDSVTGPPGSAGSGSSRGSFHSRAGSLDSDWERISQISKS